MISSQGRGHVLRPIAASGRSVLPSFTLTYQWVRELRRRHSGVLFAVRLRLPDDQPVTVGHYDAQPPAVTAAQAVVALRAPARRCRRPGPGFDAMAHLKPNVRGDLARHKRALCRYRAAA
jgi:hypothetical protein